MSADCILWQGTRNRGGYGTKGRLSAHREALAAKLGRPIAPGMCACHHCDNPPCVNPDYLYEGTPSQNAYDAFARGRRKSQPGERHPQAKLTDADVALIRDAFSKGVTQTALAIAFGVTQSGVSRIVRGLSRTPEAREARNAYERELKARKRGDALGVPFSTLAGRAEARAA